MPTTEPELRARTPEEMEAEVGQHLKRYRIDVLQVDQLTLAARAGISVRALRNLELGSGSTLRTFLLVVKGMDRYETILGPFSSRIEAPVVLRKVRSRQRVRKSRNASEESL